MNNLILIFCEAISYGHAVRTLIITKWLKQINSERLIVATTDKTSALFMAEGLETITIDITDPLAIYERLRQGGMMYEKADLLKYFPHDEQIIQKLQPQLIVSDFRFTALQLAKKYGIPSVGITDATCHPNFKTYGILPDPFCQPSWIPLGILQWLACSPLGAKKNQEIIENISVSLREASSEYGVEVLPSFFDYASQGDVCLLCDHPELIPIQPLRKNDIYTGALLWQPQEPLPSELDHLDPNLKTIYVSLGTQESLPINFLDQYLEKLLAEGVQVIVSLGKRNLSISRNSERLFVFDFVNDSKLLPLVDLIIYPGGQMTTYQALACGVPLIALPAHSNQHFYAEAIVNKKLGYLFRPSRLNLNQLVKTTIQFLHNSEIQSSVQKFQEKIACFQPQEQILSKIKTLIEE